MPRSSRSKFKITQGPGRKTGPLLFTHHSTQSQSSSIPPPSPSSPPPTSHLPTFLTYTDLHQPSEVGVPSATTKPTAFRFTLPPHPTRCQDASCPDAFFNPNPPWVTRRSPTVFLLPPPRSVASSLFSSLHFSPHLLRASAPSAPPRSNPLPLSRFVRTSCKPSSLPRRVSQIISTPRFPA